MIELRIQRAILSKQLLKASENTNGQRNLQRHKESSNHVFITKQAFSFTTYICSPKDTKANSVQVGAMF